MTCPLCNHQVVMFYRVHDMTVVAQCDNPACIMSQRHIETTGDSTIRAHERFTAKAAQFAKPNHDATKQPEPAKAA